MDKMVTIIIADDHPIFRSGVRQVLEKQEGLSVVAEAENGEQALKMIFDMKPEIAILDIQMPSMTGLAVAQHLEHAGSETKVILLTMLDDRKIFLEAMDAGVMGYLLKDSAVADVPRAIVSVRNGKHYISQQLAGLLVQRRAKSGQPSYPLVKDLTQTELKILTMIADLKSNSEIAAELFISQRTVENHRVNMAKKLTLQTSKSLLKFALQHKDELQ